MAKRTLRTKPHDIKQGLTCALAGLEAKLDEEELLT